MPTAHEHITPAASPIAMAARGPTKPAAGVMPTRPATAPDATPSDVHLRVLNASVNAPPQAPAAAPRLVARKADAASPLAARALPALKPNQPNHRMPAPSMVKVRLWGAKWLSPKPLLLPINSAAASAAMPALMWTTVPPAKSRAPSSRIHPPDQMAMVGTEGERVSDYHPQHRHKGEREDALHQRPENVLGADHAPIEEC